MSAGAPDTTTAFGADPRRRLPVVEAPGREGEHGAGPDPGPDPGANQALLRSPDSVLATLRADGTRRWIRPRPQSGRFLTARRALAYALMAVFLLIPIIHVGGQPLVLLDLPRRQFTLFGTTFVPTDTPLLMLLVLGAFVSIFLLTALFGRVWCGWACPQTVYMEFLFRPLEHLIEGGYANTQRLDRDGVSPRRVLKNASFVLICAFLAHTFLAYFVGWKQLLAWMGSSPLEHPTAFLLMGGVTAAMVFDFVWFREQTCLVACPYGRFQSVLMDRQSLIVGYDRARGEPRGKLKKGTRVAADAASVAVAEPPAAAPAQGDCIACSACVTTCPTGIDIRDGLQMECIGCTQCIDACDAIMDRIGRPRGLIRYSSQAELEGTPRRLIRPRVLAYVVGLLVLGGLLVFGLHSRAETRLTLLRALDAPFVELPTGEISNRIRIKVNNLGREPRTYRVEALDLDPGQWVLPQNPLTVPGGEAQTVMVFVNLPRGQFVRQGGKREVTFLLRQTDGAAEKGTCVLLGPRE